MAISPPVLAVPASIRLEVKKGLVGPSPGGRIYPSIGALIVSQRFGISIGHASFRVATVRIGMIIKGGKTHGWRIRCCTVSEPSVGCRPACPSIDDTFHVQIARVAACTAALVETGTEAGCH